MVCLISGIYACRNYCLYFNILAGTPPANTKGGMSLETTEPAAIIECSPILTLRVITEFAPIQTPLSTVILPPVCP